MLNLSDPSSTKTAVILETTSITMPLETPPWLKIAQHRRPDDLPILTVSLLTQWDWILVATKVYTRPRSITPASYSPQFPSRFMPFYFTSPELPQIISLCYILCPDSVTPLPRLRRAKQLTFHNWFQACHLTADKGRNKEPKEPWDFNVTYSMKSSKILLGTAAELWGCYSRIGEYKGLLFFNHLLLILSYAKLNHAIMCKHAFLFSHDWKLLVKWIFPISEIL